MLLIEDSEYTLQQTLTGTPDHKVVVSIFDSTNTLVISGDAALKGGVYTFVLNVPTSPTVGEWRAEWSYTVSNGAESKTLDQRFHVKTKRDESENDTSQSILLPLGEEDELILSNIPYNPKKVTLSIKDGAGNKVVESSYPGTMAKVDNNDETYSFVVATPANLGAGEYLALWRVKPTGSSMAVTTMDRVIVPTDKFWMLNKKLRMFIDKIQKRVGIIQHYTDAEVYEDLHQGVSILNSRVVEGSPVTNWTIDSLPDVAENFLLCAGALWALRSQYLLEGDLNFSYDSQAVNISYDHTGFLESEIGRLMEEINERWPLTKKELTRRGFNAYVGGRQRPWLTGVPQNLAYNPMNQFTTLGNRSLNASDPRYLNT